MALLAGTGGYVGWALTAPLPEPVITSQEPRVPAMNPAPFMLPTDGAAALSVSGGEEYFGPEAEGMWVTSGSGEPRPIASISKLITALVILDAHPLTGADDPGPTITFTKAAHDLYDKYYVMGATIAAMPTGSSMSLHDALATMLIPSASNYAEAISTWAFGSQWAFLQATRIWLDEHGLTDTTIYEPTGIDPRNTSTPADLIAIAKLAAANPAIAQITSTRALTLPGPGPMVNTNNLLGSQGINGLKTGNLGQGTYSLLFTAAIDVGIGEPLRVFGVRLGGATREGVARDVKLLLDGIIYGFQTVPLAKARQEVGTIATAWGSTATMVIDAPASIYTWSDTPITMTMDLGTPDTYTDGEAVGTITWTAGPHTTTADVRIDGGIQPPTGWWRLTNPTHLWD
ncbi:hypothetical protein P0L94_15970 [Microbacter sp. GSS18]|nr:hypothetical protein P0L94_15970 [Microbacter sp. GSS18]